MAPLRLGGLSGKQSTPSDWLGGTGEVSMIGERERHGAHRRHAEQEKRAKVHFFLNDSMIVGCMIRIYMVLSR